MKYIIATLFAIVALPQNSYSIELSIPLNCKIGENCFIQNYVDMAQGAKRSDYKCGMLSYDKHKGTDFAISTRDNISVLASADGIIAGVRNNIEDINFRLANKNNIKNIECGNGVLIKHGDEWETQYCHMKQGSISLQNGQHVKAGDKIGEVGISGFTEFKHLHISVRKNGNPIDPFSGKIMETGCQKNNILKGNTTSGLWKKDILSQLKYTKTNIVDYGVKDSLPISAFEARNGNYRRDIIGRKAKIMLFWIDAIIPQIGDIIEVSIEYPKEYRGRKSRNLNVKIDKINVRRFQYFGIKKTSPTWDIGYYNITYSIKRKGMVISKRFLQVSVE